MTDWVARPADRTLAAVALGFGLFTVFWIGWLVLLPVLVDRIERARTLVRRLPLPVPALMFGLVMVVDLALSETYGPLGLDEAARERIAKIRECAQAVVLVTVALSFWRRRPGERDPQPTSTRSRETGVPS